jgi:hypothetical protein
VPSLLSGLSGSSPIAVDFGADAGKSCVKVSILVAANTAQEQGRKAKEWEETKCELLCQFCVS